LEDLVVDGRITLDSILEKYDGKMWTGYIWLMTGTSGRRLCEQGNEPSCYKKSGEFLD